MSKVSVTAGTFTRNQCCEVFKYFNILNTAGCGI